MTSPIVLGWCGTAVVPCAMEIAEDEATCTRCRCYLARVGESSAAVACTDRVACDERVERAAEVDEMLRAYRRRHGLPEPTMEDN